MPKTTKQMTVGEMLFRKRWGLSLPWRKKKKAKPIPAHKRKYIAKAKKKSKKA